MEYDWDKVDEVVLALLSLGLHEECRAWKGFDWDAMNRLHEKRFISDPRSKAKSVVFTEEGQRRSLELFDRLFGRTATRKNQISDSPPRFPHSRCQI